MTTTEAKPATSPDDLLETAGVDGDTPVAAAAEPAKAPLAETAPSRADAAPSIAGGVELTPDAIRSKTSTPAATSKVRAQAAMLSAGRRIVAEARRMEPRVAAVAGTALVLGAILGAGATSLTGSQGSTPNAAVASLATAIDAGRGDTAKLAGTVAKLEQTIAELKTASEAARRDAKGGNVADRLAQLDRSLAGKIAGLGERIDQAEREQANRIAALASRPAKAEPTQTGSLAEPRERAAEGKSASEGKFTEIKPAEPKALEKAPEKVAANRPPLLENYAVRDVYDGAAIVEGHNRRLFQVALGDTLPGAGRVEGIERQGRTWVVVTRQGIVTPQPW